jgi:hypothetical protein
MDRPRPDVDHLADAPVELGEPRLGGGDRRQRHLRRRVGLLAQPRQVAPLGLRRASRRVAQLARERPLARHGVKPRAFGRREGLAVLVGLLANGLRQPRRHELHDGRALGLDELDVVAVDDVAARRLDRLLAHAVVDRLRDGLVAGQDLQVPEPEEHDPEQDERDPAEHGDPPRQLGRDRPYPLFYAAGHQRREIGLRPPVV